ncbi:hypothetical protein BH11PLA2_BH11PLA2_06060 [soil metagenome]
MTLIEVLLALAVLLVSLIGIIQLVNLGSENALEATFQSDGTRLAQSKLAEAEAGAIDIAGGGSGTCDDEPNWNWSLTSEQASVPNLYTVTVNLTRKLGSREIKVTLTQMIFDPLQMGAPSEVAKPTTTGTTTTGTTP